uniref:tRNA pseudouridine(55) synthase n=1 Tax=uncultured marine group II/III euryarchaeote AD1000_74_G12 TaxID=1457807 RepID=A0A075FYF1_9EURY|nr:major facilitator permease superfamily protein (PUS10) [uncultured marine group II/III euryarchaeote AD1000_74_G12]
MDPDSEEDDDWTKYADTGYTSSYDPWADMVPATELEEEEFDDEFDEFDDTHSTPRDIPRCPAPSGIEHAIRIGTCNHCLGRVAGVRIAGDPLQLVGERVREQALERDPDLKADDEIDCCPFCEDLFLELDLIATRIMSAVDGAEFSKIQLGIHFSKDHVAAEEVLRSTLAATGSRPLKASLSDAIQSTVAERLPGINWVKERPEVMLLFDTLTLGVNADLRALFLYGRYRKHERGIPQTRWPCRACRGRDGGCESCNGTGQQYPHSIQSLVCEPLIESSGASSDSFHGMGREDIDVRCLGDGRPFVAELKSPLRRTLDLEKLTKNINKAAENQIEIHGLRLSNRAEVSRIKETKAEKSYTICFTSDHGLTDDEIHTRIQSLSGQMLEQQTPQRVAHRRADKVRQRKVISIENILIADQEIQFDVRCESGTYVKELVHSDEGRTIPSVAALLEADCKVVWLDVKDIHAD